MYTYVASTQEGKLKRGTSLLASRQAVMRELEAAGLVVISVEEKKVSKFVSQIYIWLLGTIGHVEKVLFTKHLSIMVRAGLTLIESVAILSEQTNSLGFKFVLKDVVKNMEQGERFSDSLSRFPQVFSPFYTNLVRAGEVSGTLAESLERLAVQFTKEHELRNKVRTVLLYPSIVLTMAIFIGFFFATYVLPQVANLFLGLKGIHLPLVTVILLDVSVFVRQYTLATFMGLVMVVAFFFWLLRQKFLQPITHFLVLKLPVASMITKDVNLARFSLVFGTLLESGVEIVQSLEVTRKVLGNLYYRRALGNIILEVQRGTPSSEAMEHYPDLFPVIISRMINVGERSGKLEEVLRYLAEFYDLEVEVTVKNLTTILEPALLLFIGGFALAIAFAILIPIYNFIAAIGNI